MLKCVATLKAELMKWRKMTPNPKRWNRGKSPEILKDGKSPEFLKDRMM